MPIINVPPALFMVHRGVNIFHDYKESYYPVDEPMTYHYSLDVTGDDTFDVRDLPVPEGVESNAHEDIIAAAIDSGELDTGGQALDGESEYELSEGQMWLLANIHCVKNPVHTGDIPDLKNIDMEIAEVQDIVDGFEQEREEERKRAAGAKEDGGDESDNPVDSFQGHDIHPYRAYGIS